MILAAISVPVVATTAALGIGGAMVRAARNETSRTAELAALAAATYEPVLGRPTAAGTPTVPGTMDDSTEQFAPPSPEAPASSASYTAGTQYYATYAASSQWDRRIGARLGLGAFGQPLQGSLGSTWTEGCTVAEAQFAAGRAKLSRSYAAERDGSGTPVTPHCAVAGGFQDGAATGGEHVYLIPEMESTGAYRLQRCMERSADCTNQVGQSQTSMLNAMGAQFVSQIEAALGVNPGPACLVDPTAVGCFYNSTVSQALFGSSTAATVQQAFRSQWTSVTGTTYSQFPLIATDLNLLAGYLFGKTLATDACPTALGTASGQTLCDFGLNSASMLPSTLAPRVRAVVHHAVDFPWVPAWVNGSGSDEPGDFDFVSQALARRSFKNAVVVPSLPSNFSATYGADVSACLRGTTLLPAAAASLTYTLTGTLTAFDAALGGLVTTINNGTSTCGNAEADSAASSSTGFTVDLNPTLSAGQSALISAASALNTIANKAVNTVMGTAVGRDPAECNATPAAAWCVNVGDQVIRDLQDIYSPPGGGSAPTASDVVGRAYTNNEPVALVSLGKWVTVSLGTNATSAAGTVSALTYWIPALDVVPATVAYWDSTHPENTRFKVASTPSAVRGMYKAVLIDADKAYPLCTAKPSATGYCMDQPPA